MGKRKNTCAGVVKRGSVYYIRYELPKGEDGSRVQRMEACPGLNQKQAAELRAERLRQIRYGSFQEESKQTVAAYLTDWLERQQHRLAPTTAASYESYIRLHIIPSLGDTHLDKLTAAAIEAFYDRLRVRLGGKSIRNVHGILHAALSDACRVQLLQRNPATYAEPPRITRTEIQTATAKEIELILAALERSPYRIGVVIALATGMRRGEILGLKWSDLNEQARVLAVRRSVYQAGGQVAVKETKTGIARVIRISPFLVDELKRHQESQPPGTVWVMADKHGEPYSPQAFTTAFRRAAQSKKLTTTLQSLRHTQATHLIMGNVPVKAVSERLGHSRTDITQNVYTHVLATIQDQAADVVEEWLAPYFRKASGG